MTEMTNAPAKLFALFSFGKQISKSHSTRHAAIVEAYERKIVSRSTADFEDGETYDWLPRGFEIKEVEPAKPSERMRSAEYWSIILHFAINKEPNTFGEVREIIRAIQTNAASAAEPLLEEAMMALKDCVDYWPAALNDDLQEVTHEKAKAVLAKWVKA